MMMCIAALLASATGFQRIGTVRHLHRTASARMSYTFDDFDTDVGHMFSCARIEAGKLGAQAVGTDHLLLAATLQRDEVCASLESVGITTRALRKVLRPAGERSFEQLAPGDLSMQLPLSAEAEHALNEAAESSNRRGDKKMGWRQLLLEILMDEETCAKLVLKQMPAVNKWAPIGALCEVK